MIHELKTWPEYFEAIAAGLKTFELRKADRPFAVGDQLQLREWDPVTEAYTGREIPMNIAYVTRAPMVLPLGFVAMAIVPPP